MEIALGLSCFVKYLPPQLPDGTSTKSSANWINSSLLFDDHSSIGYLSQEELERSESIKEIILGPPVFGLLLGVFMCQAVTKNL